MEEKAEGLLPTTKTPRKTALSDQTILIHGRPKIGKSTFCASAPGALFLATEAGLNSLEVFQLPVSTWQEFLTACKEISEGKHAFKTIIVDTVDNALRMCSAYVRAKLNIDHESDLGYAKGFTAVYGEFYRVLNKLSLLPSGLFLVSHSVDRETEEDGVTRVRTIPTLPGGARRMVLSMVDIILYADIEVASDGKGNRTESRVVRTVPSEKYEAGDRTGRLPPTLDLNYDKFVEAFESKAPPAPPEPAQVDFATPEQIEEFGALIKELEITEEQEKKRLALLGAADPSFVEFKDMVKMLINLRALKAKKKEKDNA